MGHRLTHLTHPRYPDCCIVRRRSGRLSTTNHRAGRVTANHERTSPTNMISRISAPADNSIREVVLSRSESTGHDRRDPILLLSSILPRVVQHRTQWAMPPIEGPPHHDTSKSLERQPLGLTRQVDSILQPSGWRSGDSHDLPPPVTSLGRDTTQNIGTIPLFVAPED